MIPELEPLLNHLPPKTHRALLQAIDVCAKAVNAAHDWVQRWLAFTLIADALTQTTFDSTPSRFELKGGAAIELRMRRLKRRTTDERAVQEQMGRQGDAGGTRQSMQPRASKDLDATYRGELDELEAAVREALQEERQGFTFRVEREDTQMMHMRRFRVAVSYLGKTLSNVKLEVSAYEGAPRPPEMVPAPSLAPFGLTAAEAFPCIPLSKQIAQKLHAVTEVFEDGRANNRFRDLTDIVLLSAILPPSAELREVCRETFAVRQKQPWPPTVQAPEAWREPLERLAREMRLEVQDANAIVAHVIGYVEAIEASAGAEAA